MKVTQHVTPSASAKRVGSTSVGNLVMLLTMNWSSYSSLGMTAEVRDRAIEGLRDGTVDPLVLCETLGIPTHAVTAAERDQELLESARTLAERAARAGLVLGAA